MEKENSQNSGITLNQETVDILITNIIPTTKYFESRFDHMQYQIDEIKTNIDLRFTQVDKRFEQVDKRFDDMQVDIDKRFEQVDKRFEQVDKRFDDMNKSIIHLGTEMQNLSKTMEVTIRDFIIERDRIYDTRFNNFRMFNIALVVGIGGILLKVLNF